MIEDQKFKLSTIESNGLTSYTIDGDGISANIGGTPIFKLELDGASFYAKAEWFNYFTIKGTNFKHGSVKMRSAFFMVKGAMENGSLETKTVIEPTSGNMGIAIAALSKIFSFKFIPIISYKVTDEVKEILKMLGSKPIEVDDNLCPRVSNTDTDQAIAIAKSYAQSPATRDKYLWLNQYENNFNPLAHAKSTASEIMTQVKELDAVLTGIGTGGTYVGLKSELEKMKINVIGIQPQPNHKIQGLRNLKESLLMPAILESIGAKPDDFKVVKDVDAFNCIKEIYKKYNLLLGPSSGVTCHEAINMAQKGKKVLAILADTGQNYTNMYRKMGIIDSEQDFEFMYNKAMLANLRY
ncbi:MAG: pyridoxal-phosphate dependent enzyme [Conexivisphaerales archaeon]